ncbi:RDD family protein [Salana multivorans]
MPPATPQPTDGVDMSDLFGRRLGALALDWAIASLISAGFFRYDAVATLVVFAAMTILMLTTLGSTVGHRLLGLRVYRMDTGTSPIAPLQALIRTACLLLLLPAIITSVDGRGLHDVWAGTFMSRFGARATPPKAESAG